jgi:prepilin-type N-terminal cleavage/methylation domain-containing protein
MKNTTARRGFTLLEAIIVMVVMAVIATMGAPTLSSALRQRTVTSAADQLVLAHSMARSTALRYGRVAQLHVDASTVTFWVDVDTSANNVGQRATISTVRNLSGSGLTMYTNRSLLCFDSRGLAATTGGCQAGNFTITFKDADKSAVVTSTTLGKVVR